MRMLALARYQKVKSRRRKKKKIWGQYLDFREKEKEFGASFLARE